MKSSFPWYLPFIVAVTATYLTIEIPFSAQLLDVLAANPSSNDIDLIEKFGRCLTGFAVAIAVVGWFLARSHNAGRSLGKQIIGTVVLSVASVGMTYFILDRVAVATGDFSTAEARKNAFQAIMAKPVMLERVNYDPSSSDWKAFVAMAAFMDDGGKLLDIAGSSSINAAKSEASRRLGTVAELRAKFFDKDFDGVRNAYLDYKEGSEKYLKARHDAEITVANGWGNYLKMRERAGYKTIYNQVELTHLRSRVVSAGIPIPANWHPDDRATFDAAHRSKLLGPIDDAYARGFKGYFGDGVVLPPGMDFAAFLAHPALQNRLRKDVSLPASQAIIRPTMSDADFTTAVYVPMRDKLTKDLEKTSVADVSSFEDGRQYADSGKSAVRLSTIPMLAIFLSLAGALLHVCKLSGYSAQIFGRIAGIGFLSRWQGKYAVGIPVAAAFLALMYIPGNAVTASKTFGRLTMTSNAIMSSAMDVVIGIQPRFQPIGHLIGSAGPWKAIGGYLPTPSQFSPALRTAMK